jgi:hypothetical protein
MEDIFRSVGSIFTDNDVPRKYAKYELMKFIDSLLTAAKEEFLR